MNRNIIRDVCLVLEKERNLDDKVITNMTEINRKLKTSSTVKEVASAIDMLEGKGFITVLEKNKRKTILKINDDLLNVDDSIFGNDNIDWAKSMGITITPKKLMDYLVEISKDNKCIVRSKELVNYFNCTYMALMKIINSLKEKGKLDFTFNDGTLDIEIHSKEIIPIKPIAEQKPLEDNNIISGLDGEFDKQLNEIFDSMGENMFNIIEYCKSLESQNRELQQKLERSEIVLKRKTDDCNFFERQIEQLKEKNDRLFKENVFLRVK